MTTRTNEVPWTQKHRPKALGQVVGNREAIEKILGWLRKFNAPASGKSASKGVRQKRAILLYGPPGTGKTVTVEAIARDLGYVLVETNASDFRTPEQIEKWIARSVEYQTLDQAFYQGGGKIILFDEVDGISGQEDRGGVGAIIKVIKETKTPIFLTANDIYHPRLRELRQYCFEVGFKKLEEAAVASCLGEICGREGVEAGGEVLLLVAKNAGGDLRAAVNNMQALSEGRKIIAPKDVVLYQRDEQLQVFEALQRFFAAKTWAEARRALEGATVEPETMMLCIHESLPYQFKDPHDLKAAYDLLSSASMFLQVAQRERAWQLMRYFFDLATGVPFSRSRGWPSGYVRFSQRLVEMSRSRSERALRKEIGLLIGGRCHVSSAVAVKEVVPYLRVMFSANPEVAAEMSGGLELGEEMVRYLSPENADQILRLMK